MYKELVKQLRDAAKISEGLAVLLPHSEGDATAKLYNKAADAIEKLSSQVKSLCKTIDLYQKLLGGHPDPRGEDGEPGINVR